MAGDPRVRAGGWLHYNKSQIRPGRLGSFSRGIATRFTVSVIGASTGIGEHIAYSFAKARASNIISSRTQEDLDIVAEQIRRLNPSINLLSKTCDVSKAAEVEDLAGFVARKCGRLDVLILNAGYAGPVITKMHEGEPEWVQKAFEINTLGTYLAAHYFVPLLLRSENGAKGFLAIGSIAGCIRCGVIANTGYTVSKMAQIRLVECLHEQYGADGLVSLAIHPGAVLTRMAKGNTPDEFLPCEFLLFLLTGNRPID